MTPSNLQTWLELLLAPLLFDLDISLSIMCNILEPQSHIFGPLYGCLACNFIVDEPCARLTEEIEQHPLHPHHNLTLRPIIQEENFWCSACYSRTYKYLCDWPYGYQCNDCDFRLDVRCATCVLPFENQQGEGCVRSIEHFSHEHPLSSFSMKQTDIPCKACRDKLQGEVYGCPGCGFFMHKSCVEELPREILHFLHPYHPLVFLPEPRDDWGKFRCDSCSVDSHGFVFTCEICRFHLDPVCALRTIAAVKEGAAVEITHFSHKHQLSLCYWIGSPGDDNLFFGPTHCVVCGEPLEGLVYRCPIRNCYDGFMVHKRCAECPQKLDHPLHPQHPLTLQPYRESHFVGRFTTEGLTYCCEECQFFLSAKAAFLNPTLKHPTHEHDLTYLNKCRRDPCNYCGKHCNVDYYVCILCNFNVHYSCIRRLPLSIKPDCHFHPLVLREKDVPYRDDQYCDACESRRRPDRGVYFCEECPFVTHIGCVIPWVEIEDFKSAELKMLIREIRSVKDEIWKTETKLKALKVKLQELKEKRDDPDFGEAKSSGSSDHELPPEEDKE